MTISDQVAYEVYTATGSSPNFVFNHPCRTPQELSVKYKANAGASEATWTYGVNFTVTGIPDANGNYVNGLTVVASAGNPPAGATVSIERALNLTQTADYTTSGKFPAETHEKALDKLTLLVQDLKRLVARCVVFTATSGLSNIILPAPVANKAIGWNATADQLINDPADFATTVTTVTTQATNAAASASAAASSQTAAASSASSASTSASNASSSASAASTSASAASTSATNAATSATSATNSKNAAATSETNAASSASAASTSASAASTSASAASTSATNAATSEANALTYKNAANTSATNAATSETNAAASATAAAASAASVNLRTVVTSSANYTVTSTDKNKLIDYTGSGGHSVFFTAAATLGSGFEFHVKNGGSGNVTLDPNGAETVDGSATVTLTPGQAVVVVCDGFNFLVTQARGYGAGAGTVTSVATGGLATGGTITGTGTITVTASSVSDVETGTGTSTANTPDSLATLWEQGTDIASAAPLVIPTTGGGYFNVTGTTGFSRIDKTTVKTGRRVRLKFAGALTLTHGTNLILPGAANITTAAGDVGTFICEDVTASNQIWRCVGYQKANGQAVISPSVAYANYSESSNITISSGGSWSYGPSIGNLKDFSLWLKCTTTELNYAVGDMVKVSGDNAYSTNNTGAAAYIAASALAAVNGRFGTATGAFEIQDISAATKAAITNSKWALVVRAVS